MSATCIVVHDQDDGGLHQAFTRFPPFAHMAPVSSCSCGFVAFADPFWMSRADGYDLVAQGDAMARHLSEAWAA